MNMFYLDASPEQAAKMMSHKHVIKMILESGQLLSSAHYLCDQTSGLYRPAFLNHPCTQWAARSASNYDWLYRHFKALAEIYEYRTGKKHKTWTDLGERLAIPPFHIPKTEGITPVPQVMPEQYRVAEDPIAAYRNYYEAEKFFTEEDAINYYENI